MKGGTAPFTMFAESAPISPTLGGKMRTDNASKSRYGAATIIWAWGQHPVVLDAMHTALDTAGAGSGGTRNIGGSTIYHKELEVELADLHNKPAALLFTSAFNANEAALSALSRLLARINSVFGRFEPRVYDCWHSPRQGRKAHIRP